MENIVNIQDHQVPNYPALAAEKIAAELKQSLSSRLRPWPIFARSPRSSPRWSTRPGARSLIAVQR